LLLFFFPLSFFLWDFEKLGNAEKKNKEAVLKTNFKKSLFFIQLAYQISSSSPSLSPSLHLVFPYFIGE